MKKILSSTAGLILFLGMQAQLTIGTTTASNASSVSFYMFKPPHFNNNSNLYPLIISLHGAAEIGDGTPASMTKLLGTGIPMLLAANATMEFNWQGKLQGFVVMAPQNTNGSWDPYYVDAMVQYGKANLRVDPNRIFITGYSFGGGGTWIYPTSSAAAAQNIAGIAPVSARNDGTNFCNIANNQVATWAFHAIDDPVESPTYTTERVGWINACTPLRVPAIDTIYPDGAHAIWNPRVYDTTNNTHYPNLYQWMLTVNRSTNVANNHAPIARAGGTITLEAPVKHFYLDGSSSYDSDLNDLIMDYYWQQISGPSSILSQTQWPTSTVYNNPSWQPGMPLGTYQYRLRVKDYLSVSNTDILTINVVMPASGHAAPATDAGPDATLAAGVSQYPSVGQATNQNPGGWINTFNWRQIAGPGTASLRDYNNNALPYTSGSNTVMFTNMLLSGKYTFEFSATNNLGDVGKDTINLFVGTQSALPLNIIYFKGSNQRNGNLLQWQTAAEINTDHFELFRSIDGLQYNSIGTVAAKGNKGVANYSFQDAGAAFGTNFYKLIAIDKDGKTSLAPIITVNNLNPLYSIENYPNPVRDQLTVSVKANVLGAVQVMVTDMQGKVLRQEVWNKTQFAFKKELNVSNLQNGVYQLVLSFADGSRKISGFVKN